MRFVLKAPWPDFMTFYGTTATGSGWIVPKKYVERVGDDGFKKAPDRRRAVQVRVASRPASSSVLEAFDGYWRKAPSVKRVVLRNIPDETTRAAALKRGDVDVAYNFDRPGRRGHPPHARG